MKGRKYHVGNEKENRCTQACQQKARSTGTPLDSSCIGGALRFFLYLLMMAIAFLFLGAVLNFHSFTLRLIINLAVVLLLLTVMFQSGAAAAALRSTRLNCISAQGVEPNAQ